MGMEGGEGRGGRVRAPFRIRVALVQAAEVGPDFGLAFPRNVGAGKVHLRGDTCVEGTLGGTGDQG